MVRRRSIRFRLALWYFGAIAFGLAIFGVGSWLSIRMDLYEAIDDSLQDRIQGVERFLGDQIPALSMTEMRDEFREHSVLGPGGDLFQVCDETGTWLYRSAPLENNQVSIRRPAQIGSALLFEDIQIERTPLRLASQRVVVNGKPYTIQVAAPVHEFQESLQRIEWSLVVLIPVALLLSSAGGYWVSRRALAPVDQITATARSISIQNLSDRLPVPPTGDELQRLSETLNQMMERLDDSVQRIKQFTADASHELRAPLALIRTTAELTLGRVRTITEYEEAMREVLLESERTTLLLDSLLTLARGDAGIDTLDLVPMDIAQSVREAVNQGRVLAAEKQILLEADLPSERMEVEGDPQSIRRLFLILIDNAVKYSERGGQIGVALRRKEDAAVGLVSDSGVGISQEDQAHVFDRCWRADKVRSREVGGAGLGLAIAQWIVRRHHGTIELESAPGQGSIFRVSIPVLRERENRTPGAEE